MNPSHSCKTKLSTLRYLDYEKRSKWKAPLDKKNNEWYFCTTCGTPVLVEFKVKSSKMFPKPKPVYTKDMEHHNV